MSTPPVTSAAPEKPAKKKPSSVRHPRAIQRDRSKRPVVSPSAEQVEARLKEIVHPATMAQVAHYWDLGLRERVLTLPVMVAVVLSLIWRQVGGLRDLARLLCSEGLLWAEPVKISSQAIDQRLGSLPAELFAAVLESLLPALQARWQARQRPLPPEIAWAQAHYAQVFVVDGSTLDGLVRKIGLVRSAPVNPLAGRMMALLDLRSRLPHHLWFTPDPTAHDQRFWPDVLTALRAGSFLIFDLGYTNFTAFAQLTAASVTWLTRAKRNLAYQVERTFVSTAAVHDQLIWIGAGDERQCIRLIEVLYHGTWYRYLTNELDLAQLPTAYAVALYWQRWRIEDAYAIVKRLLGLAYFWNGSENGVTLQLWATWIVYAVLIDLTDAVAEALNQPFAAISLEMVYRSVYYFTKPFQRGETADVIAYLVANAKLFGLVKAKRKGKSPPITFPPLTQNGAA
jgi:hypothetical protein